jgi:hypothetical protein
MAFAGNVGLAHRHHEQVLELDAFCEAVGAASNA